MVNKWKKWQDEAVFKLNIESNQCAIHKLTRFFPITNAFDFSLTELTLFFKKKNASLSFIGVVFPYSPRLGRYNMNFHDAEVACLGQGAVVASFEQLFQAWKGGLDWCNAGWLSDGTVQYPITNPRQPCGGNLAAGLRSYGRRDKTNSRYDVFCYTTGYNGA